MPLSQVRLTIRYEDQERAVLLPKGPGASSPEELESVLRTAFGTSGKIAGLRALDTGALFPLSLVTRAPAVFGETGRAPFELIVAEGDSNSSGASSDEADFAEAEAEAAAPRTSTADALQQFQMSAYDAHDLMELFSKNAPSGEIDQRTFVRTFFKFLQEHPTTASPGRAALERTHSSEVLLRLFDIFDTNNDGVVDTRELLAGLSVLCGGDRDDKISAAFRLYDANGDGYISLEEMEGYLTSVFRVIEATSPDVFARHAVSPEELGRITAKRCFAEADANHDGRISFEEFRHWYAEPDSSAGAISAMVAANEQLQGLHEEHARLAAASGSAYDDADMEDGGDAAEDEDTPFPRLAQLRRDTGIGSVSADLLLAIVAREADVRGGVLDRAAFRGAIARALREAGAAPAAFRDSPERAAALLDTIFFLFDTDQNGVVDSSELAAGLSVLCQGSRDDKVSATFRLYDADGDGFISLAEMQKYLTSVFRVLYEMSDETREAMATSAEELGRVTAQQCFAEADTDKDGRLSFDEFRAWYSKPSRGLAEAAEGLPAGFTLEEVRRLTNLSSYGVADVIDVFAQHASETGVLSRPAFYSCLQQFQRPDLTPEEETRAQLVAQRLFSLFDVDGNGVVDFTELASGFSVLCGGSGDEKVNLAFQLYDLNGDGHISQEEMTLYLTSVFRMLYETQPGTRERLRVTPEELAAVTTQQCFDDADLNRDGKLSVDEFRRWYATAGTIGTSPGAAAAVAAGDVDMSWVSLAEVKRLTNLQNHHVEHVVETFARLADDEGVLDRDAFKAGFRSIVSGASLSDIDVQRLNFVVERLFDLFDSNSDGVVDFTELASGLSVLCNGSRDDKVVSAFRLFDYNGDGFIDLNEMTLYLTSVFKVLYATTPGTEERMGASADELARVTAESCFEEADLNHDGRLSLEEFQNWYSRGGILGDGDAPRSEADTRGIVGAAASLPPPPEWTSLEEVKRLTNLEALPVDAVMEEFARGADEEGLLSKPVFVRIFNTFINPEARLSSRDQERARVVVERLFALFDTNGDGSVDFAELGAGLSVLCAGTREDKVDAAFKLLDINGDGYISEEEMILYLSAMFRVLFDASPDTASAMGVDAHSLAEVTTRQAFEEADVDSDGRLSREEFDAWYQGAGDMGGSAAAVVASATSDPAAASATTGLAEARRIARLENHSADEVFRVFVSYADENGDITPQSFLEAFSTFVNPASLDRAEADRTFEMLMRLFKLFDTDGNGVVSLAELSAGLSILCGGSRDDKVRALFSVFDVDGDGYISVEELTTYLQSVFVVLFETEPGTAEAMGVSPYELARITADQCFKEADLNGDNQLSLDEFRMWYESSAMGGGGGAPAKGTAQATIADAAALPLPSWMSLEEVKRLTQLHRYPVSDVIEAFASHADDGGELSRAAFFAAFDDFVHPETDEDVARTRFVLSRLFETFDSDNNGKLDFSELASGLSILCGGSREDKVQAAFSLFDYNGDGFIDLDEMVMYLSSVFKVAYETQPGTRERMGVPPEELAQLTAAQCFQEADLNHDGRLSWSEFRSWYLRSGADATSVHDAVVQSTSGNIPAAATVDAVKHITTINRYDAGDVLESFAEHADEEGLLSREAFIAGFSPFIDGSRGDQSTREVLSRLFDVFDADDNGMVDFAELASGLSVLAGGTGDDKVNAAFSVLDANGDGVLSRDEVRLYLTSVFRVMYATQPGTEERVGIPADELAEATTEQCFADADTDRDGYLTREEFKEWYTSAEHRGTKDLLVDSASEPPAWVSLAEVKRLTNLESAHLDDVLEVFAGAANEEGVLDRRSFNECFALFLEDQPPQEQERTSIILGRLFDVFDEDGNGVVDFTELASGLSVLCGGARDEKIRSAFALYDTDNDGYVSRDDIVTYLTSVFRVLYETQPGTAESMGVGPDELARVTADRCFEEADLNQDGLLSLEEFKAWYAQPGAEDAAAGAESSRGMRDVVVDSAAEPPSWVSLAEVKRVTNLGSYHVQEVMEVFAECADDSGLLDRDAFESGFAAFVSEEDLADEEARLRFHVVVGRLFDLFDANSDGSVDFSELASGLSVLCGGSREDKVAASFELFDLNGDGTISKDEMQLYLTSVFKVLFESQPGTQERMGITPEELAEVTTTQCFEDADLNHDGRLTLSEFSNWYQSAGSRGLKEAVVDTAAELPESKRPQWVSLEEMKRLTSLYDYHVSDVLEVFAQAASEDGVLTPSAFAEAMSVFSQPETAIDERRAALVVDRLFSIFDQNGDGVVDFSELASGLSVLCGGEKDEKALSAFQLFDINGDGYIDRSEMKLYLQSVFRVLYEGDPGLRDRMRMGPDELAAVTTDACFDEADLNSDGRLSRDEFIQWTERSGLRGTKDVVVGAATSAPAAVSLDEARALTKLEEYPVEEVFAVFARGASDEGKLDREAFDACFDTFVDYDSLAPERRPRARVVMSRLFDIIDADGDGFVDFDELASGLTILSGGSRDAKVEAAFNAFDYDGDGYLTLDEVTRYLTSVFRMVYSTQEGVGDRMGVSPEDLAAITAEQCLAEADTDGDGRISLDEFKDWYARSGAGGESGVANTVVEATKWVSLEEVRRLSGLGERDVSEVIDVFNSVADKDGNISREAFNAAFEAIVETMDHTDGDARRAHSMVSRIFDLMDSNGDGVVDQAELGAGLSILCGGDNSSKVRKVFEMYDANGDGFISMPEMVNYLRSVYVVIYEANPSIQEQVGVDAATLARVTAEECFREADTDGDGKLSYDEFEAWYLENPGSLPGADGDADGADDGGAAAGGKGEDGEDAEGEDKADADESGSAGVLRAADVREVLCLDKFDVSDVFNTFRENSRGGELTRDAFTRSFLLLAALGGGLNSSRAFAKTDALVNRLFTLFDRDGNGVIDYAELASGLTVFCSGSPDSKVEAAFALYDYNGDGYISLPEMERYLRSVFNVMYQLQPDTQKITQVSPEELARITAADAFEEADLDRDGRLDVDEFRTWWLKTGQGL